MQFSGPHALGPMASAPSHNPADAPRKPWPALGGFMLAMICFGAARIHASDSIVSTEHAAAAPVIATHVTEFRPHTFAPSAFADWADITPPEQ